MIKTTVQTIEGLSFNKEKYDSISLAEYKTEAIIIASNVVAQRTAKLNMYEMDDLKGYLTEKALTIVEKFDPTSTKNGWKDLGSFLFFTLSNHAKNFNQQYFNYLKGITSLDPKEQDDGLGESSNNTSGFVAISIEDPAYEDVEFFADNILGELLELLTPRQKFILKGRLDLKNNVEIASELGTTKMTVGRDLKKIQEIATDIGIAI
ncbi:sigma-70 family RNA polymerase sigma factor [Bacillus cereus]|uniref:sigma-70 family RNA polymerase sigma factor n=1 Tax=Bacillus cereus TaxID=1396 RepID=UPI00119FA3BB|nr:sigma-70 family RNA polymerase sigma factor [Bacillus cereus]